MWRYPPPDVRLGIRLQLVVALGALLVLAFVPLFFAFAGLTRATMTSARESSARALGRAVAGHVTAARDGLSEERLRELCDAQIGQDGVSAIGVFNEAGARIVSAGDAEAEKAIPSSIRPRSEELVRVKTGRGAAVLVVIPSARDGGAVAVVVGTDPSTIPSAPLFRLVGLYTGTVALALLIFAYIAMTRLVVRPVDELSRAARRVAEGARRLDVPRGGARELGELGASLSLMTERQRADEEALRGKIAEIERYAADLESAQRRLVRSERLASVGRLSAGLAHEIGNPLAAILGFQELLLEGDLDEAERRDFLERMKRETERIHRIVRDLLDFARPSAPELSPEASGSPGSVDAAARDAVSLVAPQPSSRGVEITLDIEADLPLVALSSEGLVQVLVNLLLNAADAAPKPGGKVVVRARRRRFDDVDRANDSAPPSGPVGQGVRIEVEDNGPGIAPDVRDTLFEPFVTTKEVGKGTGLGLAVCRGLVLGAEGRISAGSASSGGARFVVDLPSSRRS